MNDDELLELYDEELNPKTSSEFELGAALSDLLNLCFDTDREIPQTEANEILENAEWAAERWMEKYGEFVDDYIKGKDTTNGQ